MTLPIAAGLFGIEHFTPPWDIFFLPLFNLLVGVYTLLFSDFALAIIIFTVVIRTLLAPLFVRQIRSQKEMQRMSPLIREVNRKHKGNRTKIAEETQALYREHGVNPAAGCLPVVLQMPLLLALYQALIRASNSVTVTAQQAATSTFTSLQASLPGITKLGEIKDAAGKIVQVQYTAPISGPCNLPQFTSGDFTHFLPLNCQLIDLLHLKHPITTTVPWLGGLDLAKIDHVFAVIIPGTGFALSALAVVAALLQFVQVRMSSPKPNRDDPTSSTTSTMTYLFPLLTVWWGGLFASGLILYWVVYTAYLIAQQFRIMGWGNFFPLFGWHPPFAGPPDADLGAPPRRQDPAAGSTGTAKGPAQPASTRTNRRPGAGRPGQRTDKQKRRGRKR